MVNILHMTLTLHSAIATFGQTLQAKLCSPAAIGQPEDQLRAPFEQLLRDMAELLRIAEVTPIGESAVRELKTRPDYCVTIQQTLVGFVELKAPGKGANPTKFKDKHDKAQWQKLQALPNLMYSDGNGFSLWQDGELVGSIVTFDDEIETAGNKLQPPAGLLDLFQAFFLWQPIAPRNAKELARISARLCRFLRDEVTEQLKQGSEALTTLAGAWRELLFPEASDVRFADGYAQAVTFGLLMARAKGIELAQGFNRVADDLRDTNSLIGEALRLLTNNPATQTTIKTSLQALTKVLDAVDWPTISQGDPDTWLYFYEDFLEVYDNTLRRETGSYYTPPEVVDSMTRLVDEVLKSDDFGLRSGLASPAVTVVDPAMGTGTYVLGVLKHIARSVSEDEGEGAVKGAIEATLKRLIAFELQLGAFAVAQLRILAEVIELTGETPREELRMFVTDTLCDPEDDAGVLRGIFPAIAKSRQASNQIKREEPVTVVIGNPPYRERAKGFGGWVEAGNTQTETPAPLLDWIPPKEWGVSAHAKHLRNLYVYFWRWATWKVFDCHPDKRSGIVCFITVAGFLNGPGFQRMREYLRDSCDRIWVIHCSPEGHQPEVNTRIFQGVQQPVCIVLASRSNRKQDSELAIVKFRSLPHTVRTEKFAALAAMTLTDSDWVDCPQAERSPFLPKAIGAWTMYPPLECLFHYNGSGVMPGRTWVIAPDQETLAQRWNALIKAKEEEKERLFHPHQSGDRHTNKIIKEALPGQRLRSATVADDQAGVVPPVAYAYRSFDRQWIIPDKRLINRPNPKLWGVYSSSQIYLTALSRTSPSSGSAITFTELIPDLDHYKGSFGGRVFPLWANASATLPNIKSVLINFLCQIYDLDVKPEDAFAYIAAIAANPHYTERFRDDLATPGLRIPLTADPALFVEAAELGKRILWLHTYGERLIDRDGDRPPRAPRMPKDRRPTIPKNGAISDDPEYMPDTISHDPQRNRLLMGNGYINNVTAAMWNYEVSGKQTILQWFSYRKQNRDRPIIGNRRSPSPLNDIQPDRWLAEYTTELLNLLNILGLLIDLEPQQADLLDRICAAETLTVEQLQNAQALTTTSPITLSMSNPDQTSLF